MPRKIDCARECSTLIISAENLISGHSGCMVFQGKIACKRPERVFRHNILKDDIQGHDTDSEISTRIRTVLILNISFFENHQCIAKAVAISL